MVVKVGVCERCRKTDVIGYIACVNENLCSKCAAPIVGIPISALANFLHSEITEVKK